ncbi:G2/mitotic-specific cyclin-4 [Yarrowia sp. C11]|nr:G2/mitotic-specific cyclin-4 [Yarrowia sp. E02]KAG5372538.1 G2/mitotic-specific cyclin-4 [Yarrowia sp. C11]
MDRTRTHDENSLHEYRKPTAAGGAPTKRVALGTVTNTASVATKAKVAISKPPQRITRQPLVAHNQNIPPLAAHTSTSSLVQPCPGSDDTVDEEVDTQTADVDPTQIEDEFYESEEEGPIQRFAVSESNPLALYPLIDKESIAELNRVATYFSTNNGVDLDENDDDTYDISMVAEYAEEIFTYMKELEVRFQPNPGYMDSQTEIHWAMRSILVDWLVQVHHRFSLLPETLFLTINYIDRFLSIKTVSLSKLQLVGAVALFVAAKYEEINCPSVQEIAYMVDNGYHVDEILKAERYMIDLLDFNLGWPGPMSFLRRTSKADDYDLETRTLAKYLLEVTIMEKTFVGAPPSWLAAAAHFLSRRMLNRGHWTDGHTYYSGYTEKQLLPAVMRIIQCCRDPLTHHKAIFEKYKDRKFKRASVYVQEWMDHEENN